MFIWWRGRWTRVSRREKEKAKSLDALARIAYSSPGAPPSKPSAPAPRPSPRPSPPPPAPRPSPSHGETSADRARRKQLAERKEKLEEEKRLRARRANELAKGARIDTSRIDPFNIPASIRRTGFDRVEPTVSQKLHDILGDAKEKEGRAKARDKGKRQGGR